MQLIVCPNYLSINSTYYLQIQSIHQPLDQLSVYRQLKLIHDSNQLINQNTITNENVCSCQLLS